MLSSDGELICVEASPHLGISVTLPRTERGDADGIPEFTFVFASCLHKSRSLAHYVQRHCFKFRSFVVSALLLQRSGLCEGRPHRVCFRRHAHDGRPNARFRSQNHGETPLSGSRRPYLCHSEPKRLARTVCFLAGNRLTIQVSSSLKPGSPLLVIAEAEFIVT